MGTMGSDDIVKAITAAVSQAPDWVRRDLASKDALTKERAEETLAAIISAALKAPD